MTLEALLGVVAVAWVALAAGLWRLSAAMDRIERFTSRLDSAASAQRRQRRG